ncbi:MAG TPA: hypothetical protein VGI39_11220, partial [Polyangiaceae bacterium]
MSQSLGRRVAMVLALFALTLLVGLGAEGCLGNSNGEGGALDASLPGFDAGGAVLSTDGAVTVDGGITVFPGVDAGAETSTPAYPLGGQVVGLAGTGLTLADNAGDPLTIAADGPFVFPTLYPDGTGFTVSVTAQPSGPVQTCSVAGGQGTVQGGPITGVVVTCATDAYPVGGQVVGLASALDAGAASSGLVLTNPLADGGKEELPVAQNGSFAFPTQVPSGGAYDIEIASQPVFPAQTCTVSGGTGTVVSGAVTSAVVNCATNAYVIGGTVSGLAGTGLVLANGTNTATVNANGTFAFSQPVPSGGSYAVTVQQQPKGPSQTCTVTSATGTVQAANVASVQVSCATNAFAIGGQISGLAGSGLVLASASGETLAVAKNGSFAFTSPIASGASFGVTVKTQPTSPWQTCTVTGGSGTVGDGPVTSVSVACTTNAYAVGGTVSGLAGSGLTLAVNGGAGLVLSANGPFSFPAKLASGTAYGVTVAKQPTTPSQTCAVSAGTGTIEGADLTGVKVTCSTNAYAVGGTVIGLLGSGLVLTDNGGDSLAVAAGSTSFTFKTPVASGAAYAVKVATQPSAPSQTCVVSGGSGTLVSGAVTSVIVNCATNSFTVGGTVSGLAGTGLVLANGASTAAVNSNGTFAFATPVTSGSAYDVTVKTQPVGPSQTCSVSAGTGTVTGANVTSVAVTCTTNTFTVGGAVSGLAGSGLVLDDNGGDALGVGASGSFTFATRIASGGAYAVTLATQPTNPWQTCTTANGTGTVGNGPVSSVLVSCATNTYSVGGALKGLAAGASVSLTLNGSAPLTLGADGAFAFPSAVTSGASYVVSVQTQPANPWQTCAVSSGSGTVGGANVGNVAVNCTTNAYAIGGTVSGLVGSGLVLTDNGGDAITLGAGATSFTFPAAVTSGAAFNVQVRTQPSGPTQRCTVSGGNGTVAGGAVHSVQVNCDTQAFVVGGTVSGLAGQGLVLQNGADTVGVSANGSFAFPTPVASGATYAVTVKTQPTSPTQSCVVAAGSGTVTNGAIGSVQVTCTTTSFSVSGTVTGLAGAGLVLADNGTEKLTVSKNGAFTFAASVPSGAPYAVTVATSPTSPWQTCTVTGGSGNVGNGPVTGIEVACVTNTYTIGGKVSGLAGSGLTLTLDGGSALSLTASGPFVFPTAVASGASYAVAVASQPSGPTQTCTVSGDPNGTVQGANVGDVAITCTTNTYAVSGSILGLAGSGLVLTNVGGDAISVAPGATSFTFPTKVASGAPYDVEVETDPTGPSQHCSVSANQGTVQAGAVTGVVVNCSTDAFTVSGTVTGLAGKELVLSDGAGDTTAVSGTAFSFTLTSGTPYAVAVAQSPTSPWQTCTVTNGAGTVANTNVSGIAVTCTTDSFTVSGTVSGLSGKGLQLADGAGDAITVSGSSFSFTLASGTTYNVSVAANPTSPSQTCSVTGGAGTVAGANVTGITVSCTTNSYTVSGTVSGLTGKGLQLADGAGDTLAVSGTSFSFTLKSGTAYALGVAANPAGPSQTCSVSNGSGTITNANVGGVVVTCTTNSYVVSGTVSGLTGNGLVLSDGAGDTTGVSGTSFSFTLKSGASFAIGIAANPTTPSQSCTVTSGGSGTVTNANVSGVVVTCTTDSFTVSGTVRGLLGSGLQITDGAGDTAAVGGTSFSFTLKSGTAYAFGVAAQPTSPWQTCAVTAGGSGTVTNANVSGAVVTCTTQTFTVSGTVSGLTGSGLQVSDGVGQTVTASGGSFAFTLPSGTAYTLSIASNPTSPWQTCTVTAGASGTVTNANIGNATVSCSTNSYAVGVSVSGLASGDRFQVVDNLKQVITIGANGSYTFSAAFASGSAYSVSFNSQPGAPVQNCFVNTGNASGA